MKQGLQLRLSQQLAMTPQLQQAIRLLQLSTLELQQEIQTALESNPLLEQADLHDEVEAHDTPDSESLDTREAMEQKDMPEELPLDATWDEIYSVGTPSGTGTDYRDEELPVYQSETTQTLQDYLMWQVELTPFSDTDKAIATSIVDAVDDTGYLTVPLDDILDSIGDESVTMDEVETVLKRIQRFDPVGVAARDLRDFLLIQLSQFPVDLPYLNEARLIVSDYLNHLLGSHDFRTLLCLTKLKEEVLKPTIALIQLLDPRSGQSINTGESHYVIPDVLVRKLQNRWVVELNTDSIPTLRINQQYAALGSSTRNYSDGQFIRRHLQEARWLIKSLESRNEKLMKVTRCIVERQRAFFEQGEEFMRPMVLPNIAQAVDMHESMISRVTTKKYLHNPRGIFELKYFFSSHVNTEGGSEASSTAIRALVKKLIAAENPAKPLSGSKLTDLPFRAGYHGGAAYRSKVPRVFIHPAVEPAKTIGLTSTEKEDTMQLNITGQHVDVTDALREFVTTKFSKLEQFFDRINQVYILLKVEKVQRIAEATVHLNGGELHATRLRKRMIMYAAIDLLIGKLTRQLNKHKKS